MHHPSTHHNTARVGSPVQHIHTSHTLSYSHTYLVHVSTQTSQTATVDKGHACTLKLGTPRPRWHAGAGSHCCYMRTRATARNMHKRRTYYAGVDLRPGTAHALVHTPRTNVRISTHTTRTNLTKTLFPCSRGVSNLSRRFSEYVYSPRLRYKSAEALFKSLTLIWEEVAGSKSRTRREISCVGAGSYVEALESFAPRISNLLRM